MNKEIIAIITARGGSKGLPRKNLRLLAGKPLIAHSILAAINSVYISRCIVSTEDEEIKKNSLQWGAEVYDRPSHLASDTSLSRDVIRHILEELKEEGALPTYFTLLQPTSPLRTAEDIDNCLAKFFLSEYNSAVSVTVSEHHPYKCFLLEKEALVPLYDMENLDKPRQSLPKVYRANGAIYVVKSEMFLKENSFFVPPMMPYEMSMESSIDIDTEFDLSIAEKMMGYFGNLKIK